MTPSWILDVLAAVMLAVAAVSTARLVATLTGARQSGVRLVPGDGLDIDLAHVLMAIAMAGMLTPALATLPDTAWVVIFAIVTAWFALRVARDARASGASSLAAGHCAPHLVHGAAMVYMFVAVLAPAATGTAMSGTGAAGGHAMQTLSQPTVAFAFAIVLAGYCVWDLDRLSGRRYSLPRAAGPLRGAALAGAGLPAGTGRVSAGLVPVSTGLAGAAVMSTSAGSGPGAAAGGSGVAGVASGDSRSRNVLLSGGTTVACRIAMGVAMAFMLIMMI
jgi:hypothetical protein